MTPLTAAEQALTAAIHTLHCAPLFARDPGHPPGDRQADLDRARARFLLGVLRDQGWALTRTGAAPAVVAVEPRKGPDARVSASSHTEESS